MVDQEIRNFIARREQCLDLATKAIQRHAPLMNYSQAREIAKISLLSWQDLRQCQEWAEISDYLMTL